MSIGQRLKDARLSQNMTQEELAVAVGITKGAIGNYETEVSSPKETILIRLMEVLHVDANFLYQDYMQESPALREDELTLLALYNGADERAKEDAIRTLSSHQKKGTSPEAEYPISDSKEASL